MNGDPTTSKAAVLKAHKVPLDFRDFPLPDLKSNSLIAKVTVATVCGTDIHLWRGDSSPPLPLILGHEAVGKVHKLGSDVKTDHAGSPITEGDRIIWGSSGRCGKCYSCVVKKIPERCANSVVLGIVTTCKDPPHLNGNFSEFVYLRPPLYFFKIPDSLSDKVASPASCALSTVMNGTEKIDVRAGDSVVIQGAGPLGLYGVAVAKMRGAEKVIVIDKVDSRLKLAEEFGADHTLNMMEYEKMEDRMKEVMKLTGGYGADHVIELTGSLDAIPEGVRLVRPRGTYLLIGSAVSGEIAIPPALLITK
ncbi:MAG: zinc-binding dehydrogenase, partial [Nitrososphaerales archaeon]